MVARLKTNAPRGSELRKFDRVIANPPFCAWPAPRRSEMSFIERFHTIMTGKEI